MSYELRVMSYELWVFSFQCFSFSKETDPLGTGGAIRLAINHLPDEEILVLNGDSFFDISLAEFYEKHQQKNGDASLALRYVLDTSRYGTIDRNGENKIICFLEKIMIVIYLFIKELIKNFWIISVCNNISVKEDRFEVENLEDVGEKKISICFLLIYRAVVELLCIFWRYAATRCKNIEELEVHRGESYKLLPVE